ncbi:type VI secretion system ATPase TssH [Celerinatantimonas diazotrophica]|uniref:Type VI secretion system protein VasG n=1 Tax=Celerinatantimonas diazotrophica TaxID=412034 RepID=A0A4R1K4Y8_9GAMM|nr:type VI secretion system ATPase TssH [Celerinatantimonas diazotrophica]TCK59007.1 type VI secretion system protein VasG [Celerinatantimonas diazotrophica]CAG9297642.1 Protein ClpV1 [Celerinatantimonas diazotrophica]
MIQIELPTLIKKLNSQTKLALEQAAAHCMARQNPEVTFEHLLFTVLDNPLSDIREILKICGIDWQKLKTITGDAQPQEVGQQSYPAFSPLLVELLQDAWLLSSAELNQPQLRSGAIFIAALMRPERYLSRGVSEALAGINRETLRRQFSQLTENSAEAPSSPETQEHVSVNTTSDAETALGKYCSNFTQMARDGELDPVLCRDDEINLMIDILCRRRKNNPIVVGDAGVGKSAVVEGLAQRIVKEQVPTHLQDIELLSLDLGLLQAGASVKGEFERRLKSIIDEVKNSPKPIILFIDEAHTLIGAGNQEGGGDAANLLKPALARGELSTIAATTWKEYKKYFEKDPALTRRFQLVKLEAPSAKTSIDILRGLHGVYEASHQVLISDDALKAAALLSDRYVSGRQLPDKAIDVLDTACARIAINLSSPPRKLTQIESRSYQRSLELAMLKRQGKIGEIVDDERVDVLEKLDLEDKQLYRQLEQSWQKQKQLVEKIIELRGQLLALDADTIEPASDDTVSAQHDDESEFEATVEAAEQAAEVILDQEPEHVQDAEPEPLDEVQLKAKLADCYQELAQIPHKELLVHPQVDEAQIAQVIADWTGVPVDQMNADELSKMTHLSDILGQQVKGQQLAIERIHRHLLTARADLRRPGRPKGAFLLVGPSGVGKTETVVQLAEQLYGGQQFLTTINMSEYQEKHTVSRLIGSPPGYVGYGEGGVLTEAIRKMPYSIVLLDEVEKAHPEVLNLFYQAFDKGELADGEGRIIDCQNVVFFLTSNLGYQTIVDNASEPERIEDALYQELAAFFKPALLARMEVIPYLPLADEVLEDIIRAKLARLERLFKERYQAQVAIDDELVALIRQRATRSENGARMLEAIIEGQLLPPVSLALLNKLAEQSPVQTIEMGVREGQFYSEVC